MNFNESYKNMVDNIKPSDELIEKIKISEEGQKLKFRKIKVAALVAVACLTMGITAFAAGKLHSYESYVSTADIIYDYDKSVKYAEKLGCTLIVPQEFSNGYKFEFANHSDINGLDEDGNVMANGTGFESTFVKDGKPEVFIYSDPILNPESNDDEFYDETRMIGDIKVGLGHILFKDVPSDYVLTEEDQENIEQNKYQISYGFDDVHFSDCLCVSFEKDNKFYDMFSFDNDMTNDEWFEMAEEFINQ